MLPNSLLQQAFSCFDSNKVINVYFVPYGACQDPQNNEQGIHLLWQSDSTVSQCGRVFTNSFTTNPNQAFVVLLRAQHRKLFLEK